MSDVRYPTMTPAQTKTPIEKSPFSPTVLIAGGAGFLGSHLAQKLLEKRARVVVIDNLSQGKISFINNLLRNNKFTLIEHDLNSGLPENIKSVDYVFHLAALESYQFGDKEASLDSLLTNSLGTKALLDLTLESKAKFLLASTIDVYQGILSSYDLEHYFGPSEQEERKFSHLEAKRFSEALIWEYFKKHDLNTRIVRLAELYGPRMDFNSAGTLGQLLQSLLKGEDLSVFGEGLDKEYYIYIDDAVEGIIKAMFSKETQGKIYPLSPKDPITSLELTYLIKKFAPASLRVLFKPPQAKVAFPTLQITDEEYLKILDWKPKIKLEEGIKETLKSYNYKFPTGNLSETSLIEKIEGKLEEIPSAVLPPKEIPPAPPPKPKGTVFRKAKLVIAFLILLILLAASPILLLGLNLLGAQRNLTKAKDALLSFKTDLAIASSRSARGNLRRSVAILGKLCPFSNLINKKDSCQKLALSLEGASKLTHALEKISEAGGILIKGLPKYPAALDKLTEKDFKDAAKKMNLAASEYLLAKNEFEKNENKISQIILAKTQFLPEEVLSFIPNLLDSLPQVLGYQKEQNYLILFENSNEIRPTGGFIGSLGKLKFKEGQIEKLEIEDVYNVDGLLKEKNLAPNAPEPLVKYLKQEKLFIRDAGFNPDFPKSAETIKDLYKKATGEEIDAVAAITLDFVKELLKVTGSIYLPQYNEVIDENNLFERAQYHSEADYFEGSPQKKNFLSAFGKLLLEKIFNLSQDKYLALGQASLQAFEEKNLLVDLPPSETRAIFSQLGWDGAIQRSAGDYLLISDANLGANKANYFVDKAIDYEVQNPNRDGRLQANLKISYIHKGERNTWPGGNYKNYLRVLIPFNSYLQRAEIGEKGKETKEVTKEVVTEDIGTKRSFGIFFELEPQRQLEVNFTYILPPTITVKPNVSAYSCYIQKQPGAKMGETFNFKMIKPFGRDFGEAGGLKAAGETIGGVFEMKKDLEIEVPLK